MFEKTFGATMQYRVFSLGIKYEWGNQTFETLYYPPGSQTVLNGTANLNRHTLFPILGVGFSGKD